MFYSHDPHSIIVRHRVPMRMYLRVRYLRAMMGTQLHTAFLRALDAGLDALGVPDDVQHLVGPEPPQTPVVIP